MTLVVNRCNLSSMHGTTPTKATILLHRYLVAQAQANRQDSAITMLPHGSRAVGQLPVSVDRKEAREAA